MSRSYGLGGPPDRQAQHYAMALDWGPPSPKLGELPPPLPVAFFCCAKSPACPDCPLAQEKEAM